MIRQLIIVTLVGSAALVGLGSTPLSTFKVVLDKLAFGPTPANLHVGDTIEWTNVDVFRHTATATDHSFDGDLPVGATRRVVLNKAGPIDVICRFHPGMKAHIDVSR